MPLNYEMMMGMTPRETRQSLTERDTLLYALGVGAGIGGDDELAFTYEGALKALPTIPVVLATPGFWLKEPELGLDWKKILHADQSLTLHNPLPVEGEIVSVLKVDAIYDKGADKGALIYSTREVYDGAGVHLASVTQGTFARGDGGFGGSPDGAPAPHKLPERAADIVIDLPTRPEQALIYRLSGDYNPLHADPAIATQAGFARPILHGLCTYGVAGRALLKALCGGDPTRFKRMDGRFSSPVFPGETIRTEIWREGDGKAGFRASVVERNLVVINNGYLEFK